MHESGWIALHRRLLESDFWLNEPFTRGQAWVDLILLANHKEGHLRVSGQRISLKRGQCGWSALRLSKRWNWSRGKVKRFLNELENERMIVQQTDTKTTIITICNYSKFQDKKETNSTTDGTTDGHQTVQQTDIKQDTNNNDNNDNNDNKPIQAKKNIDKKYTDEFEELWLNWNPFDMDKGSKKRAFQFYKKAIKETDHGTIIRKSIEYCQQCHAGNRKTKHIATWLNQSGWDDDTSVMQSSRAFASGSDKDSKLRDRIHATAGLIDDLCG